MKLSYNTILTGAVPGERWAEENQNLGQIIFWTRSETTPLDSNANKVLLLNNERQHVGVDTASNLAYENSIIYNRS